MGLDEKAVEAARQWLFKPCKLDATFRETNLRPLAVLRARLN
jgi:hypothetical protein